MSSNSPFSFRQLTVLAICLVGFGYLTMASSGQFPTDDPSLASNEPSIGPIRDTPPPHTLCTSPDPFGLQAIVGSGHVSSCDDIDDGVYVRPAWGMLAVIIGIFFYTWSKSHEGLVVEFVSWLN